MLFTFVSSLATTHHLIYKHNEQPFNGFQNMYIIYIKYAQHVASNKSDGQKPKTKTNMFNVWGWCTVPSVGLFRGPLLSASLQCSKCSFRTFWFSRKHLRRVSSKGHLLTSSSKKVFIIIATITSSSSSSSSAQPFLHAVLEPKAGRFQNENELSGQHDM